MTEKNGKEQDDFDELRESLAEEKEAASRRNATLLRHDARLVTAPKVATSHTGLDTAMDELREALESEKTTGPTRPLPTKGMPKGGADGCYVRTHDKIVRGPVDMSVLRYWLDNGNIGAQDELLAANGNWIKIGDVAHFKQTLFSGPSPGRRDICSVDPVAYWHLQCRPFEQQMSPRFFYEAEACKEACVRITFAIKSRKEIALLSGESGIGKTMLCRTVLSRLPGDRFAHAYVANPAVGTSRIAREVYRQLGGNSELEDDYEVEHALRDLLAHHRAEGRNCVAIMDNAHMLERASHLQDLLFYLAHLASETFLLTLVLSGRPQIEDILRSYEPIRQRISLKAKIPRLSGDDVRSYIAHHVTTAGGNAAIFGEAASAAAAETSCGLPRTVNSICDLALTFAAATGAEEVTPGHVAEATQEMKGQAAQ
jgi:type II secretory pathway predicted ATPase ExeA